MSKIRYRVWDKKENEMVNSDDETMVLAMNGDLMFPWVAPYDGEVKLNKHDNKTLLLSTNCKDKNGVEIYEGDIVKDDNGIDIYLVKRVDGAFYLSNYIRYQETLISVGFNSLATKELVGNKFENPELLEPEVKPCPFCGGKADVLENAWGYYINCSKCRKGDSCLSGFYEKQEAIEAWNKRV